jgi:toxin ParE1/3/4
MILVMTIVFLCVHGTQSLSLRAFYCASKSKITYENHAQYVPTASWPKRLGPIPLVLNPKLGKSGKIHGTRELIPHESYRLVYEIEQQTVWVLTLVHTARQWPPKGSHALKSTCLLEHS